MDALKFEQLRSRHKTITAAHAKTCKWLFTKDEYQDWIDIHKISEHHGFLWIKGGPGTGKSTIMKFAFENAMRSMKNCIIISFFFNASGDSLEKSVLGMYRSLLYQLLEKCPDLSEFLDPAVPDFDRCSTEVVAALFGGSVKHLEQQNLICFIDALDECKDDEILVMVRFFDDLGQFAVSSDIQFHICFSSRHYPHVTIDKAIHLRLEGQEGHKQDMANYVASELKIGSSKLAGDIRAELLERASGIFLWIMLVVRDLNEEFRRGRIHALRKRLNEIPNELDKLFQDILTRDTNNMDEVILCLQWILFARRPLKLEELHFAVLSGTSPDSLSAWDPEALTQNDMARFLLNSSKGLAVTTKSKSQTIQFIHESVRDFLLKENGLSKLQSNLHYNLIGLSHHMLKECCQTYLEIGIPESLSISEDLPVAKSEECKDLRKMATEKFPFLEYAVNNMLHHADTASGHGVSQKTFVESFSLGSWITLNDLFQKHQNGRYTSNVSLLYVLAEKDLANLIPIQLERDPHVRIEGGRYKFPFNTAVIHGSENAVRALLMHNVNVNFTYRNGRTPLWEAASLEHEGIVRLLIDRDDINPNSKDSRGITPLSIAVKCGHVAVSKLLLEREDVDANSKDYFGETPLFAAATKGLVAIVKLLLTREGVKTDSKDNYNRTPLSAAAAQGHFEIVKLLVEQNDVENDSKDHSGVTPLYAAAANGHLEVVKLLIKQDDIENDSKDNYNKTPLSAAAAEGHLEIVKLLVEQDDVENDSKDLSGVTPLSAAAVNKHVEVVKLLIKQKDINVNSRNFSGMTPLARAALYGLTAVVKTLLEYENVDINTKDNWGRMPLWLATSSNKKDVVKLLLEQDNIEADSQDSEGWTPLSLARARNHEAILKLLMERDEYLKNRAA